MAEDLRPDMRAQVSKGRGRARRWLAAALAGVMVAGAAAPALAQRDDDRRGEGRHDERRDRFDPDRDRGDRDHGDRDHGDRDRGRFERDHDRGPPGREWHPDIRPRPGVVVVPGRRFEVPTFDPPNQRTPSPTATAIAPTTRNVQSQ